MPIYVASKLSAMLSLNSPDTAYHSAYVLAECPKTSLMTVGVYLLKPRIGGGTSGTPRPGSSIGLDVAESSHLYPCGSLSPSHIPNRSHEYVNNVLPGIQVSPSGKAYIDKHASSRIHPHTSSLPNHAHWLL